MKNIPFLFLLLGSLSLLRAQVTFDFSSTAAALTYAAGSSGTIPTFYRSTLGTYLYNDAPEIAGQQYTIGTVPFLMEILYYSCKTTSYYVFARTDYVAGVSEYEYLSIFVDAAGYFNLNIYITGQTAPFQRNTWIKAYKGMQYLVLTVEQYGIGTPKKTKISLYVRNQNYDTLLNTGSPTSYIIEGLPNVPLDSISATSRNLFGHKGQSNKVQTTMHMDGIMMLFKATAGGTLITTTQIDTYWSTYYSAAQTQFSNDLTYYAKLDFLDIKGSTQVVPDQNSIGGSNTYGTNYLNYGSSTSSETADPLLIPSIGTVFDYGKYAYNTNILQLTSNQDFTVEVWFRINYQNMNPPGTLMTLIGKGVSSTSTWDFGLQMTQKFVRVQFMNLFQDIPYPYGNNKTLPFFNVTFDQNGQSITDQVNQEWRMVAVNFRRSYQYGSTDAYVYFDTDTPIKITFNALYTDTTSSTREVWVGKDFHGLIRSIFVYRQYPKCTDFKTNSTDSKVYEYTRNYYQHISTNDMAFYLGNCQRYNFGQTKCRTCSNHQISSSFKANYCYSTCALNTYGLGCKECDSRCKYCTSYTIDSCLQCNSEDVQVYTNRAGQCTKDFGYYKNTSSKLDEYLKCDPRCLICKDSSNYCDRCASNAFKYQGNYCLWECPNGYIGNNVTGLCEINLYLPILESVKVDDPRCNTSAYYDEKTETCKTCNTSECLTCSGPGDNKCLSCYIGKYLGTDYKCKTCHTSHMTTNANAQCIEKCGKGFNYGLGNIECDDGNSNDGDGCSSQCKVESGWTCHLGSQIRADTCFYEPTYLQSLQVTDSNQLMLTFSRPIYTVVSNSSNPVLTRNSLTRFRPFNRTWFVLSIQSSKDTSGNWTVYKGDYDLPSGLISDYYPSRIIPLVTDFNETNFDYSIYRIKVEIKIPESQQGQLLDVNGQPVNTTDGRFVSAILGKIAAEMIELEVIDSKTFDAVTSLGNAVVFMMTCSIGLSILSSLVMFKPLSLAVILVLAMQKLYLTHLINIPLQLKQTYLSLYLMQFKVAILNWDIKQNAIVREALTNQFTKSDVYGQRFSESGYYYNNTLVNVASIGWFWLFFYFAYSPIMALLGLLLKLLCRRSLSWQKYAVAMISKPFFSASALFFVIQTVAIGLPSLLELNYHVLNGSDQKDLSQVEEDSRQGALMVIGLLGVGWVCLVLTLLCAKDITEYKWIRVMYGSLFTPFKDSMFAYTLYALYILKLIGMCTILAFVQTQWELQVILITLVQLILAIYITFVRPFRLMMLNVIASAIELILTGHFLLFYFLQSSGSYSQYNKVRYLQIYDVVGMVLIFFMMSYDTLTSLYKWYHWTKTGKLPYTNSMFSRSQRMKKYLQEKRRNDTGSQLTLLGKDDKKSGSKSPVKVRTNTFMDALVQQENYNFMNGVGDGVENLRGTQSEFNMVVQGQFDEDQTYIEPENHQAYQDEAEVVNRKEPKKKKKSLGVSINKKTFMEEEKSPKGKKPKKSKKNDDMVTSLSPTNYNRSSFKKK